MAILAILTSLAYSSYSNSVRKSRRADAQAALQGLAQAMERHSTRVGTYTSAIVGSAPLPPAIFSTKSPIDGSQTFYQLLVQEVDNTSYTLRADPVAGTDQDEDGMLELDSSGARRWDNNADGDFNDTGEDSW